MARLHLHSFGDGLAKTLLLHGLGSAGPVWSRIAEGLDNAGHGSLAPDLRGHGESSRTDDYTLDGYARDVLASCPGPWDLVIGHSLGGAVAVRAGAIDPEFAKTFLLVDPAIDLDAAMIAQLRIDLVAEAEDPPSIDQLVADHPKWTQEDCALKHAAVLATSPEVMAATLDDNPVWQLGRDLAGIGRPVHILGADLEPLYATTDFDRHTRPGSALAFEVVPGTGHSIYRDDPKTVIDRALNLLGSRVAE
ncbi:MAG: alpha/beta hydrolase [Actinomycetota bacterium]|nr:alpha/beta hydrolase [Actinomycetota bacterium]